MARVPQCQKVAKAASIVLAAATQSNRKPRPPRSLKQRKATARNFKKLAAYNRKVRGIRYPRGATKRVARNLGVRVSRGRHI